MLYKPNFCCQCSEKIERIVWKIWTSRRFCENCENEFRRVDWTPRFGAIGIILFGILGFGSYLKTPEPALNVMASSIAKTSSNAVQNVKKETNSSIQNKPQNRTLDADVALQNAEIVRVSRDQKSLAPPTSNVLPDVSVEPVYYCGAQTKKGTSCTRRVKEAGRCWQHIGQPVNLPKEKLVVRNK